MLNAWWRVGSARPSNVLVGESLAPVELQL